MVGNSDGGNRSVVQKLPDLVEWYLTDRSVSLTFEHDPQGKGQLAPEYKFCYHMDNRRITERGLSMAILTELSRKNYNYTLAKIVSALNEIAWRHYVENQDYSAHWDGLPPTKPRGRPRKTPPKIIVDEFEIPPPKDNPVNTMLGKESTPIDGTD